MGLRIPPFQGDAVPDLIRFLNKTFADVVEVLRHPSLAKGAKLLERQRLSATPSVLSFNGKDVPSRVQVLAVYASAPVSVVQLPAQKDDKGARFVASGPCEVDVWMVP